MKTGPDFSVLPKYYHHYVMLVQNKSLTEALEESGKQLASLLSSVPENMGEYRYEPGKWSVKELICHMMDAERIFAYRALRFARNDSTDLPGFEENDYAPEANAHARTVEQLIKEAQRLRQTTLDLFTSFTSEMLQRKGTANKNLVSVINIGYIIAGHETHHYNVLKERYLK
ncbi:MAG TPA: DinB family protein [Cyclobacteriaceae bacterium]|nr:DinB family protein [Cyclobacteriaceae bacterium]HMV07712.1 DinB family protein [Cyclobacteriaceae bacterium]HMV88513.1 DinB family protein [Cyclobacteriaceae bacterium]HMW98847.1 DinB family protein [Cyclobacteriaceae bacterium]HMX48520.1 DinB family protein [Cyclobacteriaceae bacterium]